MFKRFLQVSIVMLMPVLFPLTSASAQSRTAGAYFSFTGFSLSYEQELHNKEFHLDVRLKAETPQTFFAERSYPGISTAVMLNKAVKGWLSAEGNIVRFIAGAGISGGYTIDQQNTDGLFFGLKGLVGLECLYQRNVTISLCIAPLLGPHIVNEGDRHTMRFHQRGLLYSLIPEIGIKYRF